MLCPICAHFLDKVHGEGRRNVRVVPLQRTIEKRTKNMKLRVVGLKISRQLVYATVKNLTRFRKSVQVHDQLEGSAVKLELALTFDRVRHGLTVPPH